MSALINVLLPESNFRLLIVLNNLQDVLVKFFNIFVFFSFGDSFAEVVYFFEWFRNTVFKSSAPGKGACNWWIVVIDR